MTDWIEQYSAALDERDAREKAHKPYIDAYTKLADRTAAAALAAQPPASSNLPQQSPPSSTRIPSPIARIPSRGKPASPAPPTDQAQADALARLRADLATTQKARSALQTRVDELTTTLADLTRAHKTSTSQIAQLTQQKTGLERRLRDREEELRGKQKLVEDAQDEMVAQGLQMNVAEERARGLEEENRELVARWMRRMGEEAERVNRESRWDEG